MTVRPRAANRVWLNVALVLALVMAQMVFVSEPARSGNHVTGLGTETATKVNEVLFTTLETNEIQWIWNDAIAPVNEVQNISHAATGGNFTLTYEGSGESAAIDWAALPAAVEAAIEGLSTITDVTVAGVPGNYDVTFVNPGLRDNSPLVVGTNSLTPNPSPVTITETTKGGNGTFTLTFGNETTVPIRGNAAAAEVEAALEALVGIPDDLTVTGNGNVGDEWKVTFPRGVPMLTATDSLFVGKTTFPITENTKGTSAPTDPSGLALVGSDFLIADSEIEEEPSVYDDVNMWGATSAPAFTGLFGEFLHGSGEPTGLSYNPAGNGHLYISNDDTDRVYDVDLGGNGVFDTTDTFTWVSSVTYGAPDPEDVAWDPVSGQVFIASGLGDGTFLRKVAAVSPGPDGKLGGGDDIAGPVFDVSSLMDDLEGLAYRAQSDTLLLVDPGGIGGVEQLWEMTKDGRLVRRIAIAPTKAPSDVVVAANGTTFYVVDRGDDNNGPEPPPRDGKWFEFTTPFTNLAPFVHAGDDQVVGFGDAASLVGDSYDDGQGSNYSTPPHVPTVTWSKMSGPGTVNFTAPNSLTTNATFSEAGVYELKLTSSDGSLSNSDIVQVTMSPDPNQAPLANAGPDQTITLPSVANLNGTANDDGMPNPPGTLTTTWSKVSGPGTVTFGNASALSTTASFSTAGTYVLKLTADDGAKQHSDNVTITVNPAPEIDYFDDDDGNIFENDINWLAGEGITKGCGPRLYCPDDFVTRGQMAAFLKRALNLTDGAGSNLFVDDDGHLFENDIDLLGTAGITRGCNPPVNDRFCPDDVVTRGQMAAFLVRALNLTDGAGSNLFVDDDGHLFENDIDKLATAGITKGCNPPVNDRFCPDLPVTRGAMAAFLHRALG